MAHSTSPDPRPAPVRRHADGKSTEEGEGFTHQPPSTFSERNDFAPCQPSTLAVLQINARELCTYSNARWSFLTGLSERDSLGEGWSQAFHPPDWHRLVECMRKARHATQGPHAWTSELQFHGAGGELRWGHFLATDCKDAQGDYLGCTATIEDITARKAAERRLAAEHVIARVLAETDSPDAAARRILDTLCRVADVSLGIIWLMDPTMQEWRRSAVWRADVAAPDGAPMPPSHQVEHGDGPQLDLQAPGSATGPILLGDLQRDPDSERAAWARAAGVRTLLSLPVQTGGERYGILELYAARDWTPEEQLMEMLAAISQDLSQFIRRKRAEQALRESEARERAGKADLAALVEAIPGAVLIAHDADCRSITANAAGNALLRMPAGSNVSKTAPDGERPDTFETFSRGVPLAPDELPMQRAARTGRPVYGAELELRFENGDVVHTFGHTVPLFRENGEVRGCVGISIDVTVQRRAEVLLRESQARLQLALEAGRMGTWDWDVSSGRLSWSNLMYELHGLAPGTLPPTLEEWQSCIDPDHRAGWADALLRSQTRGDECQREYRVVASDGAVRWVESRGRSELDEQGRCRRTMGVSTEITDRKKAEQELLAVNATLEKRVAQRALEAEQRAVQLRALATELTQAEQRERRKLAADLHDYMAQLLVVAKMNVSRLGRTAIEPARQLLHETTQLLDDALSYARTLVADLSPIILYDAGLGPAYEWLAGQMGRHGLEVTVELPEEHIDLAENDAVLVFQSTRELLFNVIKHARVMQATLKVEQSPTEVYIEVSDCGTGFQPAEGAMLPTSTGRFGLFSIRERLGALGGKFGVRSTVGEGTTAWLRVPRPGTASLATQPASSTEPTSERRDIHSQETAAIRVLLVDDHDMVRTGLRRLIESERGIDVVAEAADGEQAVRLARDLRPEVIVMDANLPQLNGVEATRAITSEFPEMLVIALSIQNDDDLIDSLRAAGAAVFLTKGGPSEELAQSILALARDARTRRPPPPDQ